MSPGYHLNDFLAMQINEAALSSTPRKTIDGDVYVPSLLNHLSNGLSAGASRTYLKYFGVGTNDWRVMSALVNHPRATAKRVSEVLAINKAIVSRSVGVLESKRLLKVNTEIRQRPLELTTKGYELHDRIIEVALERERRLMRGFSAKEVAQLLDYLRRMYSNLPVTNGFDPEDDQRSSPKTGPVRFPWKPES